MKNIIISLSFIIILLGACTPDEFKEAGEATDWGTAIVGTWNCQSYIQIEEDAVFKGFPDFASKKDLTNIFPDHPYTDFSITLNADGSFTADPGESYVEIIPSGSWSLDNATYPEYLVLSGSGETQNMFISSLGGVVYGELQLGIERNDTTLNKTIISYELNLKK